MKTAVLLAGLLSFVVFAASRAWAHSFDFNRNQVTSLAEIIADLAQAQAVFIGETHDHQGHHAAQLQIIKELHAVDPDLSIGLEMFRQAGQGELDRWVAGLTDEAEFSRVFARHWSDWAVYREIFVYARDNRIPLIGLNIERNIVKQVARNGFASLSVAQREQLPLATCNISPAYREFIRRTLKGHPLEGAAFDHFCEAQVLWDASMANRLADYLRQYPQKTVVVLAGNGHSWKHGIPEQLARLGDYSTRVLLPEIPSHIDLRHSNANEADYLLQGVEMGPLH